MRDSLRSNIHYKPLLAHQSAAFDAIYNDLMNYRAALESAAAFSADRFRENVGPLQKDLWMKLQKHSAGTPLARSLKKPFSVDRLDDFLMVDMPRYFGENGVHVVIDSMEVRVNGEIVNIVFTFRFYEVLRREPVEMPKDLRHSLKKVGVPIKSIVIEGHELGAGFVRLPSAPQVGLSEHHSILFMD